MSLSTYFNVRNNVPYKALVDKQNSNYVVQCFENNKMVATTMVESADMAKAIAEDFVGPTEPQFLVE